MSVNNFKELLAHKGHRLAITTYSEDGKYIENVALECLRCNEVLMDFDNPMPREPFCQRLVCPYCDSANTYRTDTETNISLGRKKELCKCADCGSTYEIEFAAIKIKKKAKGR